MPDSGPEQPPALAVRRLRKTYGDFTALDDLDLTIPAGSLFGLLGPNGAGKTTLIGWSGSLNVVSSAGLTRPGTAASQKNACVSSR